MKRIINSIFIFFLSSVSVLAQKLTVKTIADGKHDKEFSTQYIAVDKSSSIDVKLLRRGGFAASLKPIE